jgi:hypothetical protein
VTVIEVPRYSTGYYIVYRDDKGAMASRPKLDRVVRAHNLFKRKRAKPILQATVLACTVNTHYLKILMRRRLDNGVKYACFLGIKPMWSGALRLITCEVLVSSSGF